MAITTINSKLGIMEWCQVYEPGLPVSPGALGQDDKQQLLNDYPGVLYPSSGGGGGMMMIFHHHHVNG